MAETGRLFPLCLECRFSFWPRYNEGFCLSRKARRVYTAKERTADGACGPDGINWEAKKEKTDVVRDLGGHPPSDGAIFASIAAKLDPIS